MKKQRITVFLIIMFLLCDIFKLSVFANSAQRFCYGTDAMGMVSKDKDCPIEVEKEQLTFDITDFPDGYYEKESDFLAYNGRVKAEYTFYNPADYTVTAKLVFPFGTYPSYGYHNYYDSNNIIFRADDVYKYGVKIDGKEVKAVLRHTFSIQGDEFNLDNDISLIQDGYVKDSFYSPDLPVTKYTYTLSGVDEEKYKNASATLEIPAFDGKRKFWLPDGNGYNSKEDGRGQLSIDATNGQTIDLYVIGETVAAPPEWKIYNVIGDQNEEIIGTMTLQNTEELSFKELALYEYDEKTGIMEADWYNVIVYLFNMGGKDNSAVITDIYTTRDILWYLMRWYEYEITLKPGEKIVNTVEAPMYPSIDLNYEPGVYGYTYLLSPASTWAKFGELNIDINTPFYMTETNQKGFEKNKSGYSFKSDGLPEGELKFSLSEREKPEKQSYGSIWFVLGMLVLGAIQLIGYVLVGVVVVIILIVLIKRFAGKKKE